jgi:hypothetical protein
MRMERTAVDTTRTLNCAVSRQKVDDGDDCSLPSHWRPILDDIHIVIVFGEICYMIEKARCTAKEDDRMSRQPRRRIQIGGGQLRTLKDSSQKCPGGALTAARLTLDFTTNEFLEQDELFYLCNTQNRLSSDFRRHC